MPSFGSRLQHAWNAFFNKDPPTEKYVYGGGSSYRPDRPRMTRGNERSIVSSIYTRIALDAAAIPMQHVRLDQNGRFVNQMNTGLNACLSVSANVDQTGRAFMFDVVMSMLDEGVVCIVPTDATSNIRNSNTFDILSMRTGKITNWYPTAVEVRVYNEKTGRHEDIVLPKSSVAIVENPFYTVMNEHNSTLQRLIRKLNILDDIDEQSGANKLDMIIQLPYLVKTEARRAQAEARRKELEEQLTGSKYGIAWSDGTEKIMQLNRPVENNLMSQIEYLTKMLYSQLGMTQAIFDGTANESENVNYYNRTIDPILSAIAFEMRRKFLTKTARSQHQSIEYFRNPFTLVSVLEIAQIADTFTRNEILSSNEIRQIIGYKPSEDPNADELRNKNMPIDDTGAESYDETGEPEESMDETGEENMMEEQPVETEPADQMTEDPQPEPQIDDVPLPEGLEKSLYLLDPVSGEYVRNPYYKGG